MLSHQRIEAKRQVWNKLSALLDKIDAHGIRSLSRDELDELGRLHRTASSHLAQAKSGARDEAIVAFLNQLVSRSHAHIYRSQLRSSRSRVLSFFTAVFPAAVQRNVAYIAVAAALLSGSIAIACGVTTHEPRLARAFIGEAMAKSIEPEQIGDGSPLVGITAAERTVLSSAIMGNNIRVGLMAFAGGILIGLPTVLVLIQNGFMLGGLTGLYLAGGNGSAFLALVLPHGVLELMAVVISGGGGLRLGYSLIAPGRLARRDALYVAGRQAILLAVGVTPLYVAAALIEGFLTPTYLDDHIKFMVAGASGVLAVLFLIRPLPKEAHAVAAGIEG